MKDEWFNGDGFGVSYNPHPSIGYNGCAETALVKGNTFFILNGDFRKEYRELVPQGFDACYDFFLSQPKELISNWSDDPNEM